MERGEQELQRQRELEAENPPESDESESGSGLETRGGPMGFNTPPDSPNAVTQYLREHSLQYEGNLSKIYQYISTVSGEAFFLFLCVSIFSHGEIGRLGIAGVWLQAASFPSSTSTPSRRASWHQ